VHNKLLDIVFSRRLIRANATRDLSEEELKNIIDNASDTSIDISERLEGLLRNDPASPLRDTSQRE